MAKNKGAKQRHTAELIERLYQEIVSLRKQLKQKERKR